MSGLDNLRREGEESTNLNPEKAEPTADGAGHGDEELGPDMRTDRSESVYSNKEAIEIEAARAYADSVSSAHSTNVKEVAWDAVSDRWWGNASRLTAPYLEQCRSAWNTTSFVAFIFT